MKIDVPDIYWHGPKERILSLDFSPDGITLITAGSVDAENNRTFIRHWEIDYNHGFDMNEEEKENTSKFSKNVKYITDLIGHDNTVNSVKFSPNGKYLASAGDDRTVIIWNRRPRAKEFGSEEQEIAWCPFKILKSHTSDVYDLCWSRDSNYLISGSVDNTAIFWNVEKSKVVQRLEGHTNFIQGVTLDPKLRYIITQSNDRTVRVWKKAKSKKKLEYYHLFTLKRMEYKNSKFKGEKKEEKMDYLEMETEKNNSNQGMNPQSNNFRLFQEDSSLNSFFRRPDWSPDGSFLLVPTGQYKESPDSPAMSVVYVYRRGNLNSPCFFIPTNNKPSLCVRFCPKLFKLDSNNKNSLFDVPYKMVFAIATTDAVLIYSTQSLVPLLIVSNISGNLHYASLTDMSWNGTKLLGISCSDGYCSFLSMNQNELGEELPEEEMSEDIKTLMIKKEVVLDKDAKKNKENNNMEEEKPNPLSAPLVEQPKPIIGAQQVTTIVNGKKKIQPTMIKSFKEDSTC
jgi:chromatin assembly factor 1 subunit B